MMTITQTILLLESEIVSFSFELTRKKTDVELFLLGKRLNSILTILKMSIFSCDDHPSIHSLVSVLVRLYRLIAFTRDIRAGKGERDLTYMMIYEWSIFFPIPAWMALQACVEWFGSWKDIRGFCNYVRKRSPKGMADPLIDECVRFLNDQLESDISRLNRGLSTSLVCKWIPREGSAFSWLHEKCFREWTTRRVFCSFSKRDYRQLISRLCQTKHIVEIKQCSKNWASIDPRKVPFRTMLLQRNAFLRYGGNADRSQCAARFSDFFGLEEEHGCESATIDKRPMAVSLGSVIRLQNEDVWTEIAHNLQPISFLPFLDVSMKQDPNYMDAVGMALMIAQKSTFGKRMMIYDHQPDWLSLEGCTTMSSMLRVLDRESAGKGVGSMVSCAVDFLLNSFVETHHPRENLAQTMTLVFFTNQCPKLLEEQVVQRFTAWGFSCPSILVWNIFSSSSIGTTSCSSSTSTIKMISGNSSAILSSLCNNTDVDVLSFSASSSFHLLCKLLDAPRYRLMERNIRSIIAGSDCV